MREQKLININTYLGWILIVGFIIVQAIITKVAFHEGRMAPFLALLSGILILPFIIFAIASVLNRKKYASQINVIIWSAVFIQVLLSLFLPTFFDKEFIYLSLVGLLFAILIWAFRKNLGVQLLVLNIMGGAVLIFISALTVNGL